MCKRRSKNHYLLSSVCLSLSITQSTAGAEAQGTNTRGRVLRSHSLPLSPWFRQTPATMGALAAQGDALWPLLAFVAVVVLNLAKWLLYRSKVRERWKGRSAVRSGGGERRDAGAPSLSPRPPSSLFSAQLNVGSLRASWRMSLSCHLGAILGSADRVGAGFGPVSYSKRGAKGRVARRPPPPPVGAARAQARACAPAKQLNVADLSASRPPFGRAHLSENARSVDEDDCEFES